MSVNANPAEKKTIRAAMASHMRFDQILNLSAWATALIEIDGEVAVDWLDAMHLGVPDRAPDAVLEVVKALSGQGACERSALRGRIADSYGALIEAHPSLAGWVARDLMAWNDWRFAEALHDPHGSRLEMDSATAYAIDFYLGRAKSGASN